MAWLFISHSSADDAEARRLRQLLRAEGYEAVFLDFHPQDGIPPGRDWERELYAQLRKSDAVVFLNSRAALESPWCFAELALARSIGVTIVPLQLEGTEPHPLLRGVQWLELRHGDPEGSERLRRTLRALDLDPARSFSWDASRPPYPGMQAFEPEDAAVFFGRAAEVKDLAKRLHQTLQRGAQRLVAVVGPSGSGKSSLVRAGLIPYLRKEGGWLLLPPMEPGVRPCRSLARVLARALGASEGAAELEQRLLAGPEALVDAAARIADRAPEGTHSLLLVIDQAEELVTLAGREEGEAFLRAVREALAADGGLWAVATVRSELLHAVLATSGLADVFNEPQLLGPLDRARLFEAVHGPARRAGLEMDEALVARMVDDTVGGDALPLLAYTLRRLWERHARSGAGGSITVDDYEAVGGVVGALTSQADAIADELRRRGRERVILPTLTRLATVEGDAEPTRRRVPLAALAPEAREVVEAFVDARLLTTRQDEEQATVEVAHEALLRAWAPLREAIEKARADLRTLSDLERLSADWERSGRRDAYLLRGLRLHETRAWASAHERELADAPLVREFLERGTRPARQAPSPDDAHYDDVARNLIDGELVIVLGARTNRAGRAAPWSPGCGSPPEHEELAIELTRRFGLDPETLELADVAQAVGTSWGTADLERAVTQIHTASGGVGSLCPFIAGLPPALIITTNLDDALERAFEAAGQPYDLVIYSPRGPDAGRFVHVPWDLDARVVERPNEYVGLPVPGYDPSRTVIVKAFGSVDRGGGRPGALADGYVLTADQLDAYLAHGNVATLVPTQIIERLGESRLLLLGHPARDRSSRIVLRRLWGGARELVGWAVDGDADAEDRSFWDAYGVELLSAELAEYAQQVARSLEHARAAPPASPAAVRAPAPSPMPAAARQPDDGPFVGLRPYAEEEADRFFGRDAERTTVLANVRGGRLVVLTAPSGAGTTSLLRAGVAGWLRERPAAGAVRHVPVWFGSWWGDPLRDLIATIEASVGAALPREGLDKAVQAVAGAAGATLLILLDQFEEHVQMRAGDPGPRFMDELARCITDADLRAHFLIAVHDDAYAGLDQVLGSRVANLYGQTIRLDHLARAAAREAITGALAHYNHAHADAAVEAEPALVEAVLDETGVGVGGEDRVDAPMLQLIMAEFWRREHAAGSRVLRLEALRAMGGAAHVIREHLPRALDALDTGERDVARDLLGYLVTSSGAKLALTAGDLADFTGHAEDGVANVLSRLEDRRIVMRVMPSPGWQSAEPPRYEIFHGALAPVILHWRARQPAERGDPGDRRSRKRWLRR